MPTIYQLKPTFQNLLRPLTQQLFRRGVTANQVTVVAMLLSCAVGALLYEFSMAFKAMRTKRNSGIKNKAQRAVCCVAVTTACYPQLR